MPPRVTFRWRQGSSCCGRQDFVIDRFVQMFRTKHPDAPEVRSWTVCIVQCLHCGARFDLESQRPWTREGLVHWRLSTLEHQRLAVAGP